MRSRLRLAKPAARAAATAVRVSSGEWSRPSVRSSRGMERLGAEREPGHPGVAVGREAVAGDGAGVRLQRDLGAGVESDAAARRVEQGRRRSPATGATACRRRDRGCDRTGRAIRRARSMPPARRGTPRRRRPPGRPGGGVDVEVAVRDRRAGTRARARRGRTVPASRLTDSGAASPTTTPRISHLVRRAPRWAPRARWPARDGSARAGADSRFTVASPRTSATTVAPFGASARDSTTTRSPSRMPSPTMESPTTRSAKVSPRPSRSSGSGIVSRDLDGLDRVAGGDPAQQRDVDRARRPRSGRSPRRSGSGGRGAG